jgi:hypothetical protein
LVLVGDEVTVYGQQVEQFDKRDVLTLTAGAPKEINFWDMDVFVGMSILSGNSDVREATLLADFKRRTILNASDHSQPNPFGLRRQLERDR